MSSTIYDLYLNNKNINSRKRLIKQCIDEITSLLPNLHTGQNFNSIIYDYGTIISTLPLDEERGMQLSNLRKHKSKNNPTNDIIITDSIDIYTDGSKTENGLLTGALVTAANLKSIAFSA